MLNGRVRSGLTERGARELDDVSSELGVRAARVVVTRSATAAIERHGPADHTRRRRFAQMVRTYPCKQG